jgi:ketosteroid isomerase-like protein
MRQAVTFARPGHRRWLEDAGMAWFCDTVFLLAWVLAVFGCAGQASVDPDMRRLENSIAAFYDAVNAGDADAVVALLTDDAIMMPNNDDMVVGKEAVEEIWRAGAASGFTIRDLRSVEVGRSGDIGYRVNSYFYGFVGEDRATEWHKTKNVHIWRRQPDGSWKLHIDIWNSSIRSHAASPHS